MTEKLTMGLRVEEEATLLIERTADKLIVPHQDTKLTFIHPHHGPGTYAEVNDSIESAGLERPTVEQTASLVYRAFHSDDSYSNGIKDLMKTNWLWAFTGNLWVPDGVYIQNNPPIVDGKVQMEQSALEELADTDPNIRFVPFGFKTEEMPPAELAQNPYVIALAGPEGAEKLAKVAEKHQKDPYVWVLTNPTQPQTRVSVVDSNGVDRRLGVDGYGRGNSRVGCAFGVYNSAESGESKE